MVRGSVVVEPQAALPRVDEGVTIRDGGVDVDTRADEVEVDVVYSCTAIQPSSVDVVVQSMHNLEAELLTLRSSF